MFNIYVLTEPRCFRQCEMIPQSALCALETNPTEATSKTTAQTPWTHLECDFKFICDYRSFIKVILLTSFVMLRIHLHNSHMRF